MTESAKKQLIAESTSVDTKSFVKGHANTVTACAISADDHWVASAGKDGTILQCMFYGIFYLRHSEYRGR